MRKRGRKREGTGSKGKRRRIHLSKLTWLKKSGFCRFLATDQLFSVFSIAVKDAIDYLAPLTKT